MTSSWIMRSLADDWVLADYQVGLIIKLEEFGHAHAFPAAIVGRTPCGS
jgi:hypothetical protein